MTGLSCILLFAIAASASARLTNDCLACMCFVSSDGCQMPSPVCSQTGACGPWAITEPYWKDGEYQMGDFYNCVSEWDCNESTVRAYLYRYVGQHYPDATCEMYARTHVGGPFGASADYTLLYWYRVKDCLDFGLLTPPTVV